MIRKVYFFSMILLSIFITSQEIPEKGMPFLQNYLPKDYGNHGKIWEITSAKNGLIYMASDNGLLEFDGQTWNRYRNYRGYTRSLSVVDDSTIYIGADMDFGVWKRNSENVFVYQSLYPEKNKTKGVNEEFWGTYQLRNQIIFISHQNIYTLKDGKISKISSPNRFSESFQVEGKIYGADEKKGLYEFDGKNLKFIAAYPNNSPIQISGIYKYQNTLFLVSSDKGIFRIENKTMIPFSIENSSEIFRNKVFSFTTISNKYLAFGTILNGIYITDFSGKIIQHLNKSKGIPNNTVLSIFYQKNGKIWAGLDYGISSLNIQENIAYFYNNEANFGTGYTAALQNNTFYLGTNQGLYYANWDRLGSDQKNTFQLISNSEGQVWKLQEIDGKILCGHDKGLFEIQGTRIQKMGNEIGVMSFYNEQGKYLLVGNYEGISIFKKSGNDWYFFKKMDMILGAVNQILKDNEGNFWVNIPNYAIIKFSLDKNLNPIHRKIINTKNFKGYFPFLYNEKNGIHLITNLAQYQYVSDRFLEEERTQNNSVKDLFSGFYKPIIFNKNFGFYSVNNGFALENMSKNSIQNLHIGKILFRNSTAYNNQLREVFVEHEKIPFQLNNINITFLIPNEDGVEYQYFLENFSENWSRWSALNSVDFLDLKEGNYTLLVKAKKNGKISEPEKFNFRIKAPWYRTFWSYLSYFLLLISLVYFLRKYQQKKLNRQKQELLQKEENSLREQAEKHREEMMLEKQKLLELERNKLKEDIRNKTIELATKAKEDEDKNRILHTVSEKITEIEANPSISGMRLKEIRRMVKNYIESEDHTFEIQMDELHQDFFKSLKRDFPNLSIYDLRLCAYLKLGLNSREMSEILQVLPSSINVSRSRLRKKLGLQPDDDLFEFLNKFG